MNLEEVLLSGMSKVASVIATNSSYDNILGDRLNAPGYQSLSVNEDGLLLDRTEISQYFADRIGRARPSYYKLSREERSARNIAFASTSNNRRELAFLQGKLSQERFASSFINLADSERARSNDISPKITTALNAAFSLFVKSSVPLTKGLLHQVIAYASFIQGAHLTLSQSTAQVLVVANDHSPGPVAYAKIASLRGMKTVYLQHAEVTEHFPALDFDLSILRNSQSKATYLNRGTPSGGVLVLAREQRRLRLDLVSKARLRIYEMERRPVVIYPSGVSSFSAIERLYRSLKLNCEVSNLSVKLHPAAKNYAEYHSAGMQTLRQVPGEPHVAVCGNSSVVIELMSLGNLVYQCFDIDSIPRDYYGFVASGLVKELPADRSSEPFVYKEHIPINLVELGRYDPRVETLENIAEGVRSHRLLRSVFSDRDRTPDEVVGLHRRESLLRDLYCFPDIAIQRSRRVSNAYGDDYWLIRVLEKLFAERDTRLVSIFSKIDIRHPQSVLEYWLATKAIDWNGKTPTSIDLERIVMFTTEYVGGRDARAWLEAKTFDIILRHGEPASLLSFVSRAKVISPGKLSSNRKVSVDRYIRKNRMFCDRLRVAFEPAFASSTPLERLKLSVQNKHDIDGNLEYMDFRVVEEEFLEVQPTIAPEYKSLVQRTYRVLGGRTLYVDVERNPLQRRAVLELVERNLKKQSGFAFIRLSDGEGFIFQEPGGVFSEEDSLNRQRHWWGQEIEASVLGRLRADLQSSVYESDLVGIPSVYRFLRDHSDKSVSLLQNIQGRGLISVLNGLPRFDTPNKRYTDDKANLVLFTDHDVVGHLAKLAGKVVVVSSGTEEAVAAAFAKFGRFVHIPVPTHYKTAGNVKYSSSSLPLPYVYDDVSATIEAVARPGDLVLVAAGVAGKVFVRTGKRMGAVALDMGSAMDQLLDAGIHSLY